MTTRVLSVTFDCRDPLREARFWASAPSYTIDEQDEGVDEVGISDPTGDGPALYFSAVPEPKTAKNRMHLDLEPGTSMEEEVERLVSAGATVLATHRDPSTLKEPYTWTVMQDPEGNEFCVATTEETPRG